MAQIILDLSTSGGLAPKYFDGNRELRIKGTEQQYADGFINPTGKMGYLSPANVSFTDTTNGSDILIAATITDTVNSDAFFFGGTTFKNISSYTATSFNNRRTVTGATATDLEFYTVNGIRKLFYSYEKAGGGDIGIFDLTSTYNDTFLSATVGGDQFKTGATNKTKMIVADNGLMYILDGSSLHKFDGTTDGGANGTATANVLVWPANFQLMDAIDLRGSLWNATMESTRNILSGTTNINMFSEKAGVYVWNRMSSLGSIDDFIPIDGVREIRSMHAFQGLPACFTISSTRRTQLRIYDGNRFKVVADYETEAYPRYHDSVHISGDKIVWLGNNGFIYSYGKDSPEENNVSHKIGDITAEVASEKVFVKTGAILGVGSTNESYYMSTSDSTPLQPVKIWLPQSTTGQPSTTEVFSMVKLLPKLSEIVSLTLFYPPLSTSGVTKSADLKIYFNQSTTSWGTTAISRTDSTRGWKYIPIGKKNSNSIQLGFTYAQNTISFSITPSYAIVELKDRTTKKK